MDTPPDADHIAELSAKAVGDPVAGNSEYDPNQVRREVTVALGSRKKFDLDAMFKPRSIALIGVSSNFTKLSGRPLRFLQEYGYPGKRYLVNPKYKEVAGLK